jgi:hypothetical protein
VPEFTFTEERAHFIIILARGWTADASYHIRSNARILRGA